ncbi:MAG: Na+/H+ antiporter NhaA [Xanthomonadales bacterium]|nr:Na+/H+ antiporter NhaA [Xanthomonadales bacterium]
MVRNVTESARDAISEFLRLESASGLLLVGAAALAMVVANSPLLAFYDGVLQTHLTVTLGGFGVDKPLLLWVNDGLMAIFFLLVGLELKREVVDGQLSSASQITLPGLAALGGLAVPALMFWLINRGDGSAMNGWAIPTATDIAFALALLTLLGSRVPVALKILLTTIAIIDDLAAIMIIAVFYSGDLGLGSLAGAGLGLLVLFGLNRAGVQRLAPYMLVGAVIWLLVLKSGVHATLAGVAVAAFIPLRADDGATPARQLEHNLHPWVAFLILPLFAFSNAGVSLQGLGLETLSSGVSLGIILGLFAGKQVGVFAMIALALSLGIARRPEGTTLGQLYGVSVLCGVGFTMSLFIGSLAFEHGNFVLDAAVKLGVMAGSIGSALLGVLVLHFALPQARPG